MIVVHIPNGYVVAKIYGGSKFDVGLRVVDGKQHETHKNNGSYGDVAAVAAHR